MDMSGEHRIPAPRDKVWEALNDPEVLKACIPGCESLDKNEAGDGFDAKVKAKVGPVKANFSGSVKLENVNAPESYTISGEGKGGAAGFAKGSADVSLEEDGDETVLTYNVKAQVGGKLAQLGSRLIDSTAKKYANDFFSKFAEIVGGGTAEDSTSADPAAKAEPAPEPELEPKPEPEPKPEAEVDDGMKEAEPSPAPSPSRAAADAVDQVKQSRKGGLSGMSWVMIVIVVVLILLAVFGIGGGDVGG